MVYFKAHGSPEEGSIKGEGYLDSPQVLQRPGKYQGREGRGSEEDNAYQRLDMNYL
jgi:hypothetical protein